jgi:predicted amidophosphoribosyltransferase
VDYCPRCAETLDPEAQETSECPHCRGTRPPWDRIIRLGEYRPPLSGWIHEVKFTRWRRLGHDLGLVLAGSILAQMRAAGLREDAPVVLVPMPTTFRRRFTRGIDHTLVLARGVAARLNARIARPIQRSHRPSQTRVAPSARQANIAGAVGPKRRWLRPALTGAELVIVLDDVTTTGSTLRAACRAVRACLRQERGVGRARPRAPEALVWAAVLAKTPHGHPDTGDSA